ncbi:MAG: alkaline phosphatase family protein [Archaeoglobaceae archaeon]
MVILKVVYVVAVAFVALLLSFVSTNVALSTYESWVNYKSPFAKILQDVEPVRVHGEPIARHVVFVLLDGLSVDTLMDLSSEHYELRKLISVGAFYPNGLANTPTYSVPARASILTGAPPEVNGVLSNDFKGVLSIDSLLRSAKDEGFTIVCVGDKSVEMLFSGLIDESFEIEEGGNHGALALTEGLRLFEKYSEAGNKVFLWISVADIDMVGHLGGGSKSSEYNATVVNTGKLVLEFVESLVGKDALIVLLSDHGFKRVGHHGGSELEVRRVFTLFIGSGVKPGYYDVSYTHNDVAPTTAMLLGLRLPAQSMGRILVDGFSVPREEVEEYSVASKEQASRVVTAIGESYGVKMSVDDPWNSYSMVKSRLYSEGMALRLALVLILAILMLAGLYVSLRVHPLDKKLLTLTAIGFAVYEMTDLIAYSLCSGPTSLSDILSLGELLDKTRVSAITASITSAVFLGMVELTRFRVGLSRILASTVTVPLLAMMLGLAFATTFYIDYGSTVRFPPPDWNGGFMFFVFLMKTSFTGLVGVPLMGSIVVAFSIVGFYIHRVPKK